MSNKYAIPKLSTDFAAIIGLAMLCGCASRQPVPQLTEAKQTYRIASEGKASMYAPDELLEAKNLLDRAAEARNGSEKQLHLAYLADRQARLATSSGSIEYYDERAVQSRDLYITQLEQRSSSAEDELKETRRELSLIEEELQKKDANVDELQARKLQLERRKDELEARLSVQESALTESESARQAAEARASAALASLNELAQVKEDSNETVITLSGSVLFKTGESTLLPIAKTSLSKVGEALKAMEDEKQIVIEGHTDSQGASEINDELSQKRAQAVLDYLSEQGLDPSRMKAVGKGESDPVANNDSTEGRANNRRVELHITDDSKADNKSAQSAPNRGSPS